MITLMFVIFALALAGKIVLTALKMAWGISKVVFTIVLLPVIIVGAIILGLVKIALPFVVIGLLISFFIPKKATAI